ncbi:hypothetical protein FDF74_09420 [Clostridium niameyense]|uniref:Uncharacterized protein n=1 Tax=Clostridium niameyense TaxID=1622073 RepID=A0A6M0RB52_9CLOT|nr:hypothetical protein [Clostridium niameyense]NEZ47412.1 hypothetical protein [Clostridium niameyense]
MALQTELAIAIKNEFCEYDIVDFSLFNISKINYSNTLLKITKHKFNNIYFNVKCPLCGNIHKYNYNIVEFLKRDMIVGGCEVLGSPLFYIGKKEMVEKRANKYNEISRSLYMMM